MFSSISLTNSYASVYSSTSGSMYAIANGIYNANTQKAILELIERKEKIQTELAILDLKKQNKTSPEKVMKYLEKFKKLDYNNPANIKVLFNSILKQVIITEDRHIIIICNNTDSINKKSEHLNKVFAFESNGGPFVGAPRTPLRY